MANKRIELEHYKYFIQLGDEEPNRKKVSIGAYISIIAMMVMLVFFLTLGMLSTTLAKNPKNVLEKPEPATESMPVGNVSTDSDLTAQAASDEITIPDTNTGEQVEFSTIPTDTSSGTLPSDQADTNKRTGPSKQSKGVGNLANLANGLGGRGLQIYFLVIAIGLIILLYFPLKQIRQQRKKAS